MSNIFDAKRHLILYSNAGLHLWPRKVI